MRTDLYAEVQMFYAYQMPLLEDRCPEEFAATYTPDAVIEHTSGLFKLTGRREIAGGIELSIQTYGGKAFRHWYNHLQVAEAGDEIHTRFTAIVSVTGESGLVTWEPSCTVRDILVRQNGKLAVRHRIMRHDVADMSFVWAGQYDQSR
ncbi:MAG TPA: nuclear transport factor 2 family protein [Candidatus Limnocylindrales bacterium]|nr:nuclear transport factor 2 family protein [Candidatus Limnocylindrales bacterium]